MITKNDLIHSIYNKSDKKIALNDINKLVTELFSEITTRLQKGEEVQITDFGTFSLTENMQQEVIKESKTKGSSKRT